MLYLCNRKKGLPALPLPSLKGGSLDSFKHNIQPPPHRQSLFELRSISFGAQDSPSKLGSPLASSLFDFLKHYLPRPRRPSLTSSETISDALKTALTPSLTHATYGRGPSVVPRGDTIAKALRMEASIFTFSGQSFKFFLDSLIISEFFAKFAGDYRPFNEAMNIKMKTVKPMRALLALFFTFVSFVAGSQEAEYIGAVPGEGRSPLLRKEFRIKDTGGQMMLRVNSLGYHEAYINGVKVGDAVLTPAVSQLNKRSLVVSYDVTSLLKKGKNELVLWTGSGWYKPTTYGTAYDGPLVKAELVAAPAKGGGETVLVQTDGTWKGTWSGYSDLGTWQAHHFGGERIDARVAPHTSQWTPVDVVKVEGIEVTEQKCELCRVQEVLTPVSIQSAGEGRWVVDFGRVMNAMLDIRLPQLPRGHVSTAGFSDVRREDGSFYFVTRNEYVSSGNAGGDRFVNRFNHHVFRYVVLDSMPVAPQKEDIKALRMRTDYRRTAWFESSDDDLNRIHDMVAYTLENLAFDGYMVDCANIERLGYGGDGNASTQTLQTLFDVERLYDNWMMAWRDVMHDDGGLPHTAPSYCQAGGGPYWCSFIVQAPWRTYMNYGHVQVLRDNYAWMKHWLDYVDKYTVDGLLKKWPDLKDRWWYLGDWAAPKGIGVNVQAEESVDLVNNCTMCQVYLQLEQIARIMGEQADARAFRERYETLRNLIHERFFHPESNTYGTGSQIDMAYPMLVGVVPDNLRKAVRDELVELTERLYNGHVATGLVGIPVLTEWATLNHEADWLSPYARQRRHRHLGTLEWRA